MTDIPIIFSGSMVRALLDGRKTMTRRLAWRDAKFGLQDLASEQLEDMELRGWNVVGEGVEGLFRVYKPTAWQRVKPGDRLWVRENYAPRYFDGGRHGYAADWSEASADTVPRPKWTPCIHMPRSASRLTLIVTATNVERLQSISHDDAVAEGASDDNGPGTMLGFINIWKRLHGDEGWQADPEVVALSFRVVKANIDAPEAMAA